MNKWIKHIIPPTKWRAPVIIIAGAITGIGFYILIVSKALSYLSDDPKTCVNCHIMGPQYASWFHSSHRMHTTCNDCHVPHNNVFNKYYFKAKDGLRHATLFTLRMERQVIRIGDDGIQVVKNNCIRCHDNLIHDAFVASKTNQYNHYRKEERLCWECHREVPHGRVSSLGAMPYARVPLLESPVPMWLDMILHDPQPPKRGLK